jgi:cytochrome c biogenesis protein CcdA
MFIENLGSVKRSANFFCNEMWASVSIKRLKRTGDSMSVLTTALSFAAGLLTTLSPCVLPVLPFVTASSMSKSRWGPIFLALGLLFSFVSTTLLITLSGSLFGFEPESVQVFAGIMLTVSGLLFLCQRLQDRFSASLSGWVGRLSSIQIDQQKSSSVSEFLSGVLLGIVWTPCSGPSLGLALGLAAKAGGALAAVALLSCFGLGAVVPLILFAYGTKRWIGRLRSNAHRIDIAKKIMGLCMITFGLLIITHYDKVLEASLTALLPDQYVQWLNRF